MGAGRGGRHLQLPQQECTLVKTTSLFAQVKLQYVLKGKLLSTSMAMDLQNTGYQGNGMDITHS